MKRSDRVELAKQLDDGQSGQRHVRAQHREPVICLVWLESTAEGEEVTGLARAVDLSPGGVGLVTAHAVPLGSHVRVELILPPHNLRLTAGGRVAHANISDGGSHRIGIAFDAPPHLTAKPTGHKE